MTVEFTKAQLKSIAGRELTEAEIQINKPLLDAMALINEQLENLKGEAEMIVEDYREDRSSITRTIKENKNKGRLGLFVRKDRRATGLIFFQMNWCVAKVYGDKRVRFNPISGRGNASEIRLAKVKKHYKGIKDFEIDLFNRYEPKAASLRARTEKLRTAYNELANYFRVI